MRALLTLSIALMAACTAVEEDDDADDDGLTDDEEASLGTDPDKADTDGDGLDDLDELTAGTDPLVADTDGDGFSDGLEVEYQTNPLNPFSWPTGTGQWPDNRDQAEADGVDGSVYDKGETFPDFTATDQYGNDIDLYQFYGYVTLIDFSAGWCGPCKSAAAEADALWREYREDGFIIIHAMIDDWNGGPADLEFRQEWAEEYGLSFPVVGDDNSAQIAQTLAKLGGAGIYNDSIPFLVLLDQEMTLEMSYVGSGNEGAISNRVERMVD